MILLALLTIFANPATTPNLSELRTSFHQAVLDENDVEEFLLIAAQIESTDQAVLQAYKAASLVMKAKTLWNPFKKIDLVLQYQKAIDMAIDLDSTNVEARFLRFSIAYYLPDILGFKKNMMADKQSIVENIALLNIKEINRDFYRYIMWFIRSNGYYEESEILIISNHLASSPI